jgi:hypothetical protein
MFTIIAITIALLGGIYVGARWAEKFRALHSIFKG